jgi:transcriptional regulator with XRE-family HTH domain
MDNIIQTMVWDNQRIKTARERQSLMAKTAAESLGISPEYLSRVEHGHYTPSAKLIVRMSGLYDVPVSFFLAT